MPPNRMDILVSRPILSAIACSFGNIGGISSVRRISRASIFRSCDRFYLEQEQINNHDLEHTEQLKKKKTKKLQT